MEEVDCRRRGDDGDDSSRAVFCPGDHVYLPCNAAGIPYEHHAIVLSVMPPHDDDADDECILCVADFTADGANTSVASSGTISMSSHHHHHHNHHNENNANTDACRGLRLLQVSAKDWHKVHYPESASTSPLHMIRSRIQFLLEHPHNIPSYSLVESNCECVAVWCKTGRWTTLQAEHILKTTNHGAKLALAGFAAVAQLTPLAVPGFFVTASVITEVVSGFLSSHAHKQWEEQTRRLNQAFGAIAEEDTAPVETCKEVNAHATATDSNACDPFSDGRSLRAMLYAPNQTSADS